MNPSCIVCRFPFLVINGFSYIIIVILKHTCICGGTGSLLLRVGFLCLGSGGAALQLCAGASLAADHRLQVHGLSSLQHAGSADVA